MDLWKRKLSKKILIMAYTKGDIVWVEQNRRQPTHLKHPAVVWQDEFDGESDFIGVMLTHSNGFGNILMERNHFQEGYQVQFGNTHFVNQLFTKFSNWGPFYLGGKLSDQGIMFIAQNLTEMDLTEFEEYRIRNKGVQQKVIRNTGR
jgi:hypothetical protein